MQLTPANYHDRLQRVIQQALACGALQPIDTDNEIIEDGGFPFLVRYISSLARKPGPSPVNPFLPYELPLYVGELGDRHVVLLNKFNVLPDHVLMVTKHYESQRRLLNQSDFQVALEALKCVDGLVFYNGGGKAGASQHHKHLQLVPRPLSRGGDMPLFAGFEPQNIADHRYACWPFTHSIQSIAETVSNGFDENVMDKSAMDVWRLYRTMMAEFDLITPGDDNASGPYNLLMTREWMWLVPRCRESVEGIGLNALAYSGALLVKRREGIADVERLGPMMLLRNGAGRAGA